MCIINLASNLFLCLVSRDQAEGKGGKRGKRQRLSSVLFFMPACQLLSFLFTLPAYLPPPGAASPTPLLSSPLHSTSFCLFVYLLLLLSRLPFLFFLFVILFFLQLRLDTSTNTHSLHIPPPLHLRLNNIQKKEIIHSSFNDAASIPAVDFIAFFGPITCTCLACLTLAIPWKPVLSL